LPPTLKTGTELLGPLSAADRAVGQLGGITMAMPNPRLLIRSFIGREAVLSSRIEGTQASLSDLFLFEMTRSGEEDVPDVLEVANYIRALDHGLDRLRQIPLTLNLIRDIHRILLQGVRGCDRRCGEFRKVQNWIGPPGVSIERATYVPPPPERLMKLLDAFEKYVNTPSELPALCRLAMIHYQFEAIHPFEDGNGRVGRLIISLLLDAERILPYPVLYLSAFFERHRGDYYNHLKAVSTGGEWEAWIAFFLRGVAEQAIDGVERSAQLLSLHDQWIAMCQKARTSALLTKVIDALFSNPFTTNARVADLLDVYPQSAQNAITQLEEHGILEEITGRARNRVYVARRILDILDAPISLDLRTKAQGG
jgi:Fic family protein